MGKKQLRFDRVKTYYAAVSSTGPQESISWASIRPTPLEAAAWNREQNPSVDGHAPPTHIIEVKVGWNVDANYEMPV